MKRLLRFRLIYVIGLVFALYVFSISYYLYVRERSQCALLLKTQLQGLNNEVYNLFSFCGLRNTIDDRVRTELNQLVSQYEKLRLRLTIINTKGEVLYESSPAEVKAMAGQNQLKREEVITALAQPEKNCDGVLRYSKATNEEFYFLASYRRNFSIVVRTGVPYDLATKNLSESHRPLFIMSVVFLVALGVFYVIASHRWERTNSKVEKMMTHLRISKEALAIFDRNHQIEMNNALFTQYTDLISDHHITSARDMLGIPEFQKVLQFLDDMRSGRLDFGKYPSVTYNIEKDGRIYSIVCAVFPDGGFEISINDVSQVEEQSRFKTQLSQNIAHELKTPVGGILGYLETLVDAIKNNRLSQEQMLHFLERCLSQCERLNKLVQEISMLNQLENMAIQKNTPKEVIDVTQIVNGILGELSLKLELAKMKAVSNLPEHLQLMGNSTMIYSIFRNLCDNAINYAGPDTTITFNLIRTDGDCCYFSFADNGTGVPEEHLASLFDRFYRVDKGRSRKVGGTGLGLSIVKNAVTLHGGTISVRNRQEGGLEFLFSLVGKIDS